MARAKFKVENLQEKSENTTGIKRVIADLVPVEGASDDETITMTSAGSNPTIQVNVHNPDAGTVLETGKVYYVTFAEVV